MAGLSFSGVRWLQTPSEVNAFAALLIEQRVTSYLEVGAHHGDTWHFIGSRIARNSKMMAIDWPGAPPQRDTRTNVSLGAAARSLRREYGHNTHIKTGDSHHPSVIAAARAWAPFDCVLIDGDHTYAGAKLDW